MGTLAEVLGRRIEAVEIGQAAGMRVQAAPGPGGPTVTSAVVAEAALLPRGFGEAHLDAISGWLTIPLDRLRVRDRLRELAVSPWGDAAGDGALLRLAAVRAAVVRLLAATPWMDGAPAPDLALAAGGAWAVAPGPAVALALVDVVRRPGIRGLGHDHARLLAPLGTIEDPEERRRVIADLRDELLVPLGSVVMPAGLRGGKSIGRIAVRGSVGETELELVPGGLELVDLPPGERAVVELRFKDPVAARAEGTPLRRGGDGRAGRAPRGPARRPPAPAGPPRAAPGPADRVAVGALGGARRMTPEHDTTATGSPAAEGTPVPPTTPGWLAEIPARRFVEAGLEARFALRPGDRPLIEDGAQVTAGEALLERLRDRRVAEVVIPAAARDGVTAGARWAPAAPAGRRRPERDVDGELLAPVPGQQGQVAPRHRRAPRHQPGPALGHGRAGSSRAPSCACGPPASRSSGRSRPGPRPTGALELATDPFGELRAGGIDVGRAGSILVVGARIDAEALTRARAMGVRGIVVASLPGKELRDFQASERRQRAALHAPSPFGVLVLQGAARRRIPTPIAALFERLAGREVALLVDPPALVFEADADELPPVAPDWVHVRSGPNTGRRGPRARGRRAPPVRGQRVARGRASGARRRGARGPADRRPGALRLGRVTDARRPSRGAPPGGLGYPRIDVRSRPSRARRHHG